MNEGARPSPLAMLASETTASVPPRTTPYLPYLAGLRGLAALHVVAFHVDHNRERNYEPFVALKARVPWNALSFVSGFAFLTLVVPSFDERFAGPSDIGLDLISGVAVTCGFIAIANDRAHGKRSIVATMLSALVTLGSFRYSPSVAAA